MKPVFDENGLATVPGNMRCFYYEAVTYEYTGWSDEYINTGVSMPACSTGIDPGENIPGRVAVFTGKGWSHEELIEITESERQLLINQANEYMNSKQWPGKAAIGRLKGEELAQYNLWLDYLDALELVDTSGAPDIEWPTPPAVQAR